MAALRRLQKVYFIPCILCTPQSNLFRWFVFRSSKLWSRRVPLTVCQLSLKELIGSNGAKIPVKLAAIFNFPARAFFIPATSITSMQTIYLLLPFFCAFVLC